MKLRRRLPLLLLVFALPVCARAQAVSVEYMKDAKRTRVETPLLYVLNTPEQFVEVQFTTTYKGATLVKPPDKIEISVWSVAKKAMYRGGRELGVVVDGERLKLGFNDPAVMTGETKNGVDAFYNERGMGMQVPVPAVAKIRNAQGVKGLTMELLVFALKPDQFEKIVGAKQVEFRLGDTPLALTEGQRAILRDFASRLRPQP
jgi:hypothetical protein